MSARLCVEESAWPPQTVVVAGTGALLPFARSVEVADGGPAVAVPESIGSGGGLAALHDGEIDVALTARMPADDSTGHGLQVVELPSARVAVVAHPTSAAPLTEAQVLAMIAGEVEEWPDGSPLVYFLREPGDSSERVVGARWPEIGQALDGARQQRAWTVIYSDQAMLAAIDETPGALGILDVGLAAGATNALQIVWPIAQPVRGLQPEAAGTLPAKPLYMVARTDADEATERWLDRARAQSRVLLASPWYVAP